MNCIFSLSDVYFDELFAGEIQDFRSLEGTRFFCSAEAEKRLGDAVHALGPEGVHHIDIGDYHYLSLLWMREIREAFTLVLFDHHPDDQPSAFDQDMLSCGNWVKKARESLPYLQEVVWIGGPEPREPRPGLPVYLSLDLDILDRESFVTDWDQGTMKLSDLIAWLDRIGGDHRIIGVDICGGLTRTQGASEKDLEKNARVRTLLSCNSRWSATPADRCK